MDRVVLEFADRILDAATCDNTKTLEVGAMDVNGTVRPFIERHTNTFYLATDIASGKGVDELCDVEDIVERYGKEHWDMVVSCEILEHCKDWKKAIRAMKDATKLRGTLFISTRAPGFQKHDYPNDFWRYDLRAFREIFADMEIVEMVECRMSQGIMALIKKPADWTAHPDYDAIHVESAPLV